MSIYICNHCICNNVKTNLTCNVCIGASSTQTKTGADSNDVAECPTNNRPSNGMFSFLQFLVVYVYLLHAIVCSSSSSSCCIRSSSNLLIEMQK